MTRFSKLSVTLGLSLAIAGSLTMPSLAQTNDDDDVFQNNENSSIFGGDDNFNPFDLIHNSRLNSGRSAEQFQSESGENIDDAAASYKQNLLQYFQQQKANNASTPDTTTENTISETETNQP